MSQATAARHTHEKHSNNSSGYLLNRWSLHDPLEHALTTPDHGHRQQSLQHMPFNSAHKITGTQVHKSTLPEAHATSLVRIFQQNCKYLAYQIWVALYMILNSSEAWVPYYAAGITCINTIASTCSAVHQCDMPTQARRLPFTLG